MSTMNEWLTVINIVLTSGALWKLIAFSRAYGRMEEKVEGHDKRLDRIEAARAERYR